MRTKQQTLQIGICFRRDEKSTYVNIFVKAIYTRQFGKNQSMSTFMLVLAPCVKQYVHITSRDPRELKETKYSDTDEIIFSLY